MLAILLSTHIAQSQYSTIVIPNTSLSSPNILDVYLGDETGYTACVERNHTFPTGPIPPSYLTITPSSLISWTMPFTPTLFNAIAFTKPSDPGVIISLCKPLVSGLNYKFSEPMSSVAIDMISPSPGVLNVNIYETYPRRNE